MIQASEVKKRNYKQETKDRIFALNLLNLYTLFIALFWKQQDLKQEIKAVLQNLTINTNCNIPSNTSTTSSLMTFEPNSGTDHEQPDENCTTFSMNSTAVISDLCWETMIGQEVFKLTVMDLVFTVGTIIIQDFLRGLFVRYCNILCCWDLQKTFPEYGDFKTAENLLHLINNQGMIWIGSFFAPGLPFLNLMKLLLLVYVRCWTVMVCNVPQETIFRASRSNNFYYALLLIMLFLSMLPPLFAIVTVEPSPDCGPFSGQERMFQILTLTIENELPTVASSVLDYAASPGVIIPVFMLLGMVIYYLISVGRALRDANNELRSQLEYERTEGKRKIYAMADAKRQLENDKSQDDGSDKKKGMIKAASSVIAAARIANILSSKAAKSALKQIPATKSAKAFKSDIIPVINEQEATPVAVVKATQKIWNKVGGAIKRENTTGLNHLNDDSTLRCVPNPSQKRNEVTEPELGHNFDHSINPEVEIGDVSISIVNESLNVPGTENNDDMSGQNASCQRNPSR